jgi:hypothetical protein
MFPLSFPHIVSQQNTFPFKLIAKPYYSHVSLFNMVQIKLSVAFILAAAAASAITPVVALPAVASKHVLYFSPLFRPVKSVSMWHDY